MTEERKKLLHQISEILVAAYKALYAAEQVSFPVYDRHIENLDSIVKTVNSNFFGVVRYPNLQDKAAAYFCYIIKNHPMTDGNKRLAVLWLEVFCKISNLEINTHVKLDELAVGVENEKNLSMDSFVKVVKYILFFKESK